MESGEKELNCVQKSEDGKTRIKKVDKLTL